MSESLEHSYLSRQFLRTLEEFSALDLYSLTESDRRRFDFSCLLTRDFERPLVGQTLWSNSDGIDKDLRTLLLAEDAAIWSYVVRDNLKNRARIEEVVRDFQTCDLGSQLFKLKIFWVAEDFEAGNPDAEAVVARYLKSNIVQDILFNVVFGRLSGGDIRYFLNVWGIPGLNIQILHYIATNGYNGPGDLARGIGANPTTVRERYQTVLGSGFIYEVARGPRPSSERTSGYASLKGRVFLSLLGQVLLACEVGHISDELHFVLTKLRIEPQLYIDLPDLHGPGILPFLRSPSSPFRTFVELVATAKSAKKLGIVFSKEYRTDPAEGRNEYDLTR